MQLYLLPHGFVSGVPGVSKFYCLKFYTAVPAATAVAIATAGLAGAAADGLATSAKYSRHELGNELVHL